MTLSVGFSVESDFSSTGDWRGNFLYDGACPGTGAAAYVYDALPKPVQLYSTPLAIHARSHQSARAGSGGAHLLAGAGLWAASQRQDAETGLDYFGARYYSGAQGRFTSPDEPFADQDESDPQSWNLVVDKAGSGSEG
jgi:uncharacterized protein RhaS with RHS repeats